MKKKNFLLGCAAGVIALSGAHAADLPLKAKPIQYVKICSLYGAGFYYIPGTDTCIKIGGYVRAQSEWNSFNGFSYGSTNGPFGPSTINDGQFNRLTNSLNFTGRGVISADARTQTEYGTVRSYMHVGFQSTTSGSTATGLLADRAFIQFAGFTFGQTQSFFDIFSNTELFSYTDAKTSGDTYNHGLTAWAYTASFGNGITFTLAAEAQRNPAGVIDGAGNGFGVNGTTFTATQGTQVPDLVGNLRIDQPWGYAGVSGAVHKVAGTYYGNPPVETNGHPGDKYGWAGQVGGLVHLPADNTVGASFVYTEGAPGYATKAGSWQMYNGNSVGVGWLSDGIYDNLAGNTPIHLTNAFSVNAGFEHLWNRHWQTSVYGGYTKVWYDSDTTTLINKHLPGPSGSIQCGVPVAGSVWPPITMTAGGVGNSCSPDFSFWQVGTRTQWNLDSSTYIGLDVNYTRLNTAYQGVGTYNASGSKPTVTVVDDQDVWSAILRVQRSFYP